MTPSLNLCLLTAVLGLLLGRTSPLRIGSLTEADQCSFLSHPVQKGASPETRDIV